MTTATMTMNGGPVMATDNIINQVADSSKSLFQICVNLRQRLALVPGFNEYHGADFDGGVQDGEDPVSMTWRCLRRGYPLLTVYNALHYEPLEIDEQKVLNPHKREKAAAFKFNQACNQVLKFPTDQCFMMQDLYGDDTSGFVKVTRIVDKVLDILEERGLLLQSEEQHRESEAKARQPRDHVIKELLDTERKYVQDLESLQEFRNLVEEKGVVTGDVIHTIFANLNALLDFQRRFLIKVETQNSLPAQYQNWGGLFVQYKDSFRVYEPYISNKEKGQIVAEQEFERLKKVGHQITIDPATLCGFLLKPVQRLGKYPLILKELRKRTEPENVVELEELDAGIEAAEAVMQRTNAAVDEEKRKDAVEDLKVRVEDWKGHKISHFGDLLLFGTFTVIKGDGRNDVEREYKIYLFERILLCCKEMNPNKKKTVSMSKASFDGKRRPRLQLKGRIFMQNVTEIISLQKPGSYTIQIWWKGDPGVENFVIRFATESTMREWYEKVEQQRKTLLNTSRVIGRHSNLRGTPDTHYSLFRNTQLENPYQEEDDDDLSSTDTAYTDFSGSTIHSRNPPMLQTQARPPPRFPMGPHQPQPLVVDSPIDRAGGNSYFSPVSEPPSARTSTTFPFPRQHTPSFEENNRYTAPAMGRTPSRERPQRPSYQAAQYTRLRSASNPDIPPPRMPQPPLPPFPQHIMSSPNRSHNNSPTSPPVQLPVRSATQSPSQQRYRSDPPTQLKVKVSYLDNYVTLVVGLNITYQTLVDRIDQKLSRFTPLSIARGSFRLRYQDEDGDFITICSDEDIQMAFSDWKEQQKDQTNLWGMGEIQLYCHEN